MSYVARSTAVLLVLTCVLFGVGIQPAHACSCAEATVAETIGESSAVHVVRPRLPDLVPGRSFRVVRTLRGTPTSNLRVPVQGGQESECATRMGMAVRVLPVEGDGDPQTISLCSEHLAGEQAVGEAQAALGEGQPVGWRPDLVWLAQWTGLIAAVAGVGVPHLRRRRATD
jgi:hypothetical protein